MKIAVLSGKGGTGKTFVSVNLASVIRESAYVDCDVEAPNGGLFLAQMTDAHKGLVTYPVSVKIPQIDPLKCSHCRQCVDFCKFNALAMIGQEVKVFSDLCHSCGGCLLFCPTGAIKEVDLPIGTIDQSQDLRDRPQRLLGKMNLGQASGVPIISELYQAVDRLQTAVTGQEGKALDAVVIDCPPGSACMTMESIKAADYCLMVAEPTRFGAHNLKMVYELTQRFHKPVGVVINKTYDGESDPTSAFCQQEGIPILLKLPFDESVGLLISKGGIISKVNPQYEEWFKTLYESITESIKEAQDEATAHA